MKKWAIFVLFATTCNVVSAQTKVRNLSLINDTIAELYTSKNVLQVSDPRVTSIQYTNPNGKVEIKLSLFPPNTFEINPATPDSILTLDFCINQKPAFSKPFRIRPWRLPSIRFGNNFEYFRSREEIMKNPGLNFYFPKTNHKAMNEYKPIVESYQLDLYDTTGLSIYKEIILGEKLSKKSLVALERLPIGGYLLFSAIKSWREQSYQLFPSFAIFIK